MKNVITLVLLSCTLFLNAQNYSFEKITSLEDQNLEEASDLITFKNKLYFLATEYSEDYSTATIHLCHVNSDNTATKLTPICTEGTGSYTWTKFVAGDKLFFTKKDHTGNELWYTEDGVTFNQVVDIFAGIEHSNPSNFCVFNNDLYFNAYNDEKGSELYRCNLNTLEVTCIDLATNENSSYAQQPCVYNNKLYFSAYDETNGLELWSYDGTNAPSIVSDFVAGVSGLSPKDLIVFNNVLYFTGTTAATGFELFKFDGKSITLVKDNYPGAKDANVTSKTIIGDKLYFSAYVDDKTQLCAFDGTNVEQITLGSSATPDPQYLTAFDGHLFGQAHSSETGKELFYLVDGKMTMLDVETARIFPTGAPKSSLPTSLTVSDNKLYFIAKVSRKWNIFEISASSSTPVLAPQKVTIFSVSPNPATDIININLENGTLQGMVTIFDISGQQVISQAIEANNNQVNISSLVKGIYIVSFNNGTETFMQKVRIQ